MWERRRSLNFDLYLTELLEIPEWFFNVSNSVKKEEEGGKK